MYHTVTDSELFFLADSGAASDWCGSGSNRKEHSSSNMEPCKQSPALPS